MMVCVERHPCEGCHRRYRIWPDLLETSYETYAEPVKTIFVMPRCREWNTILNR